MLCHSNTYIAVLGDGLAELTLKAGLGNRNRQCRCPLMEATSKQSQPLGLRLPECGA
jgi:hypothetical protein